MKKLIQGLLVAVFMTVGAPGAYASSEPFIGEIDWFAGNFAPRGWAFCDGQILPISEYSALFSLLGTTYGGDGRTTFALPDVRGRVLIHAGTGPGLTPRQWGAEGGTETETLTTAQIPSHTHQLKASPGNASQTMAEGNVLGSTGRTRIYDDDGTTVSMSSDAIANTGESQSHNNMQPFTTLSCIIALQGTFPSRP